ncbi:hypothetical protein PENSPDRAFT_594882 [Peniophora sp. CONT]|nr:hypothetical protein PENSPDRAFT_594882 [Peniophora sp. CONT]
MEVIAVPQIAISPAPPQESLPEPFSPFKASHPPTPTLSPAVEDDGYRSSLLSPPPAMSTRFLRQHSPLIPEAVKDNVGHGLDADRFQRLLAASKERNTALVGKKAPDLRKEIAIKTHKSKQLERRALFLSKVAAPPSPTATLLPKTPPESPAIFHYSMPSPGLQSPLAIYDYVNSPESAMITPWIEQVDFRREPEQKKAPSHRLPSLDQIQSRLATQGHPNIRMEPARSRPGLPAFLRAPSPPRIVVEEPESEPKREAAVHMQELSRPRLVLPKRERVQQPPTPRPVLMPTSPKRRSPKPAPLEPASLQITTTVIPSTPRKRSPTDFTASNLALLSSRARTGNTMMAALRRRTSSGAPVPAPVPAPASERTRQTLSPVESDERKARRISAPAEMQRRGHDSFAHPVLALPGGF